MTKENTIRLKTGEEIERMRLANQIVAEVLTLLKSHAVPGVSTFELDRVSEQCCRDFGAAPAFKGYYGFPASLCASVNEEVVHGIPSRKRILRDGDIVSLDFGALYKGFYGDAAITLPIGEVSERKMHLMLVTEAALYKGIDQAVVGNRIADISKAVQVHAETAGFSVVRQYVGHGIGTQLHEAPEVPNFSAPGKSSPRLQAGMVLAIEPMINIGTYAVKTLGDQWTVVTEDRLPSAHFEHTVAITDAGPVILSRRQDTGIEPVAH